MTEQNWGDTDCCTDQARSGNHLHEGKAKDFVGVEYRKYAAVVGKQRYRLPGGMLGSLSIMTRARREIVQTGVPRNGQQRGEYSLGLVPNERLCRFRNW